MAAQQWGQLVPPAAVCMSGTDSRISRHRMKKCIDTKTHDQLEDWNLNKNRHSSMVEVLGRQVEAPGEA